MAKKHIKFWSLLLALVMVMSLLPMSALAEEAAPAEGQQTEEPVQSASTAISGDKTYNGVKITVSAPEGAFPAGTELTITPVGTWYDNVAQAANDIFNSVIGLFSGEKPTTDQVNNTMKNIMAAVDKVSDASMPDMVAFDVTFTDSAGNELQPADGYKVDVSFDVTKSAKFADKDASVFHIDDKGAAKEMNAQVKDDVVSVEADSFSIYAVGAKAVATYTFCDSNGTTLTGDNYVQIVKNGDTLLEPTAPIIDGKAFIGWFDAKTDGNKFEGFGTQSGITADTAVSLYARYTDGYAVYFWNAEGSKIMHTEIAIDHTTGYDFSSVTYEVDSTHAVTGWATAKGGTDNVSVSVSVPENKTSLNLYAIVNEGYWVTFDSQGGSPISPVFAIKGRTVTIDAKPTRNGYTFVCWYNNSGLTGAAMTTVNAATTLYAKWTPDNASYTVAYWLQRADPESDGTFEYDFVNSVTKTGSVGEETTYKAPTDAVTISIGTKIYKLNDKSYFTYNSEKSASVQINGSGNTVYNIYFNRNEVTLTFKNNRSKVYTKTARIDADISAVWQVDAVKKLCDAGYVWKSDITDKATSKN